jgi:hypothetical protein
VSIDRAASAICIVRLPECRGCVVRFPIEELRRRSCVVVSSAHQTWWEHARCRFGLQVAEPALCARGREVQHARFQHRRGRGVARHDTIGNPGTTTGIRSARGLNQRSRLSVSSSAAARRRLRICHDYPLRRRLCSRAALVGGGRSSVEARPLTGHKSRRWSTSLDGRNHRSTDHRGQAVSASARRWRPEKQTDEMGLVAQQHRQPSMLFAMVMWSDRASSMGPWGGRFVQRRGCEGQQPIRHSP